MVSAETFMKLNIHIHIHCTKLLLHAVYDAFEHWKELVKLLCLSERALSTQRDLFTNFISKPPCDV